MAFRSCSRQLGDLCSAPPAVVAPPPFNHAETPDVRQQDQEIMQLQSNAVTGFVC